MARDFEWDDEKRALNIKRHGVDYFRAARIFDNETIEEIDDREDYGEERMVAYGHVEGVVYRVVYTTRGRFTRIITAQKASKRETKTYYQAIHNG